MTNEITYAYVGNLTAKRGEDGFMRVKGLATDATLDLDEQICDPTWLKAAMPAWMEIGNIREMHQSKAVGKALEMEESGSGYVVEAKIVDKDAAQKVDEGIYTGFSVGIKGARVVKDADAPGGRIIGGKIVEVSLVDRPANPSCVIELAKTVGGELVKSVAVEDTEETNEKDATMDSEMSAESIPVLGDNPYDRAMPCNGCGGSGFKTNTPGDEGTVACDVCNGSGEQPSEFANEIEPYSSTTPARGANEDIKTVEPEMEVVAADAEPETVQVEVTETVQEEAAIKSLVAVLQKAGEAQMHDAALLTAVRDGIIACIKSELDEMLAGDENETEDIKQLLCTLDMFLDWWTHEASENQTEAPFTGWDDDKSGEDTMAYIGLGVSADLIKSASAEDATPESKDELRNEIVKALGLGEVINKAALDEAKEEINILKAALDEVKQMAAPGGPALRATQEQSNKSAQATALKVEAERRRYMASQVTDPSLRTSYLEAAKQLDIQSEQY